jgi:hypothetical protein
MNREKTKLICVCFLFFVFITTGVYSADNNRTIDFKISGGIAYLEVGDWNDHHIGWNESRRRSVEAAGGTVISENQPLHWGWELEGEFILHLGSQFAVGIGTGYINGKLEDVAETITNNITALNIHDFGVKAIPIKAMAYFFLPLSHKVQMALGGGLGYYFASFTRFYRREPGDGYWIDSDMEGSGSGLGAEGGISLEYALSNDLTIFLGGSGRYAKIGGIEGTRERIDSNSWSDSIEGTYYALERERTPGIWSPVVNIATEAPSGEGTRNVRDGVLDFSGFTIKAGIKIRLF